MSLGDMTYLEAFGQGILLLNSHTVAVDLLDRRSGIYSDRPSFIGAQLIFGVNNACLTLIVFSDQCAHTRIIFGGSQLWRYVSDFTSTSAAIN